MDSRGSLNGSEVNALPVNEGTFLVDCSGVANTSVTPVLYLIRRAAVIAIAAFAVPGTVLLTARRSAASVMNASISPIAKLARRVTPKMASGTSINAISKLVRRVSPVGATDVRIDVGALPSWRFIRRTERNRIMILERPRYSLVLTETRRMGVPARRNQMLVPRDAEVMP